MDVFAFDMSLTQFWELFVNVLFLHVKILNDNLQFFVSSTLKSPLVSFVWFLNETQMLVDCAVTYMHC